ncbi:MAG: M48 family metalloprotease [Actinomycetota bacterium]
MAIDPSPSPDTAAGSDWGLGGVPVLSLSKAAGSAVAIVLVAAGAISLAAPVVGAALGVAGVAALALWLGTRGRALLRDSGGRALGAEESPRFDHLTGGLAAGLGIDKPRLWIVPEGGPNAFVAWRGGGHLGVSRALLEGYTRTELEAVLAHCLVRIRSGEARATTFALGLGPLARSPFVRGGARVGGALDVAAAATTRYPPALASAVAKAEPRRGRFAASWFVAEDPAHVPPAVRVAFLEDL